MTTLQRQQHNPIAHLSADDIETLGRELDAIRQQVLDSRGERDADYIRNVIDFQRKLELGSRAVLLFSLFPPAWLAARSGSRSQRSSRTWRSAITRCTASGTGCATTRSIRRPGSGTMPHPPICGSTHNVRTLSRRRPDLREKIDRRRNPRRRPPDRRPAISLGSAVRSARSASVNGQRSRCARPSRPGRATLTSTWPGYRAGCRAADRPRSILGRFRRSGDRVRSWR